MLKRILLYAMALLYIVAGVNHFVSPQFYVAIMPPYLPWHLELVYISGVAEILCGIGLLFRRTRVLAAWATIALLVAIFPANIHVALHDIPMSGRSHSLGIWNWVRLPFQILLIAWAWWYTREEALAPRVGAVRVTKRVS